MDGSGRILGAGLAGVAIYYILARLALEWGGALLPIPLWLATAGVISVALILPRKYRWPVMLGGGVVGNLLSGLVTFGETLRSMLTPGLSVLLEIIFVTMAIGTVIGEGGALDRTRRSLKVLAISLLGAALGASIAVIETASPTIGDQAEAWVRWALGDLVGLLLLVPLALAHRIPFITPRHHLVPVEAGIASLLVLSSTIVAFNLDTPLTYLVVPAVLWLGIRFGPRLAAPTALAVALAGTYFSGRGAGPFVAHSSDAVLQVQGFNLAVALCSLVGSAHAVRAWNDHQQLAAILRALPDAIAVRKSDGTVERSWIPPGLSGAVSELVELSVPTDNPLDLIRPGVGVVGRIKTTSGHAFERRVSEIGDGRSLELLRDMTEQDERDLEGRELRNQLRQVRITEQARLGRLLHDGAIQELSVATLLIGLAKQGVEAQQVEQLTEAEQRTVNAIGDLRTMADELVPPSARSGELGGALAHYGRSLFNSTGITMSVTDNVEGEITGDRAESLYMVGREALGNVAIHSEATEVQIVLSESDGSAVLDIRDNGKGLSPTIRDNARHFGMQLMHDRITSQAGTLSVETRLEGGVAVRATVPKTT